MTNDNQDALQCAEYMEASMTCGPKEREAAAHLRRLVAENEEKESALKIVEATCDDFANQIEAKDALLRQALTAFETDDWQKKLTAANTIRQHLDQKTT